MSLLVYVKNMPFSKAAVEYGSLIARLTKTGITLLHVIEKDETEEHTNRLFDQAEALLSDQKVVRKTRAGTPTRNILEEIQSGDYQMIVMRARRAIRYRQRLGKKIGRLIAVESSIPVLIVKNLKHSPKLKRILICTGGKDVSTPLILKGAELAKASGAEVTVLHITTPIPSMYTGMDEIEETFEELLQTDTPTARHLRSAASLLAENGVSARMEVRQGDVTEEILEKSTAEDFDLVIVGSPPVNSRIKEWFMGNVTRNLVNHTDSPVLVVR